MANGTGAWVYPFRKGWRVVYRLQLGDSLHSKATFPTRQAAEAWAEECRAQIKTEQRTVGDALNSYLVEKRAQGRSDSTVGITEWRLRRLLGDVLDSPLAVLTSRRCDALYTALATSGEYQAGTHHSILEGAKTFGAFISHPRRRWLKANPFATVEKIGERADRRSESLRVDEARAFRAKALELAAGGDEGAVTALIALSCSLRPSEIVQLAARDVDDDGAVLWVAGDTLKTRNTRRPLEVADEALRALLVRLAEGKAPNDHLFPHARRYVAKQARRIAQAAGVPPVDARMLRRTFASLAARRGRSLDDLAFSMGHGADASARTAQQHYIAPGAKQSGAAGRVLGVLDGGKGKIPKQSA